MSCCDQAIKDLEDSYESIQQGFNDLESACSICILYLDIYTINFSLTYLAVFFFKFYYREFMLYDKFTFAQLLIVNEDDKNTNNHRFILLFKISTLTDPEI